MQAIHLGRSCSLGRFCRRREASSPSTHLLHRGGGGGSDSGGAVRCAKAAVRSVQAMEGVKEEEARVVTLRAVEATPESFAPFGQVIAATPDGDNFGPHDAQLDLSRGIPRDDAANWAWAERAVQPRPFLPPATHLPPPLHCIATPTVEASEPRCSKATRSPLPPPLVMEGAKKEVRVVAVRAEEATPESFAAFGQVVAASSDGDHFGPDDAQLDLSRGIPRFYIMKLKNRPLKFRRITHHASVTQCLGSIGGEDWYLGVAKPSIVDWEHEQGSDGRKPVQSRAGHYYLPPDPAEVRVFRVSGSKFLKLHIGTWHAGPHFKADAVDFYNLELSKTNIDDHTTHDFKDDGVTFVIED